MLKKFKTKTATAAKNRRVENVRGLLRMVCKEKGEQQGERRGKRERGGRGKRR